ncbi:MAG: BON domain-containing protein [Fluviicoccus sp.]|uniref:BON domain-containing protein n=1 Tax=Fluviicoccus sp. TaxID=2003552 RepID=UPI002722B779|nr:BON domain-containing protein [Fluviicoccus sp.]MDO8329796.1 BON domain-containing protein [Fluviicoccus sp.]
MTRHSVKIWTILLLSGVSAISIVGCDKVTNSDPAVHANGTTEVSDVDLTANVQRALIGSAELKDVQITAKSQKGDVLLTGAVMNQSQYDMAALVASSVSGVHTIHNEIVIGK